MPHFNKPDTVVLSAEQFAKLVELLTPGCEMAKLYLKEMGTAHEPDPEPEASLSDDP